MLLEGGRDQKGLCRRDPRTLAESRRKTKGGPFPGSKLRNASGRRWPVGAPVRCGRETGVVPPQSGLGFAPDRDCSCRFAPALPAESLSKRLEDLREGAYTNLHVDRGPATEHPSFGEPAVDGPAPLTRRSTGFGRSIVPPPRLRTDRRDCSPERSSGPFRWASAGYDNRHKRNLPPQPRPSCV